jgi:pSer/pThr/pTyr-binding forkhead associated (FHA) protein
VGGPSGQQTVQQTVQQPVPPPDVTTPYGAPTIQPQPTGSGPRLVTIGGPFQGQTFVLKPGETQIGRDATKDIPLAADSTVSRAHARIAQEVTCYTVYDLGSTNGTFVNGDKITQHNLANGDLIQIGSSKFRFEG